MGQRPYSSFQRAAAAELPQPATAIASTLWQALTNDKRFAGQGFKRQTPIGPHVVDFVSFALRCVIDVVPDNPTAIREFLEKPKDPVGLPDNPDEVLASMGNYVFDAQALLEAVTRDSDMVGSKHDMGGDIVPAFVRRNEAGVYDFKDNEVPGATERDRGYWRDVGTMKSYYDAHMDVVTPLPVFNLYNSEWPIYTDYGPQPPAKLAKGADGSVPVAEEALLSPGVVISGGQVRRSVLSPTVRVEQGALVEDSVLMNSVYIGAGAVVRNAILDKEVRIPAGAEVGVDQEADRARGFMVEDGLTVLGKGQPFPEA